jgi:hypothetical protein
MNRDRHKYLAVFSILFLVVFAFAQTATKSRPHKIVSKTKHSLASFFSSCPSEVNILIIDGQRFENVRGLKKFFLQVPNTNAIVFVTDEKDYSAVLHVFNLDTGKDTAISGSAGLFGNTIGSDKPRDTVSVRDDGVIVLCQDDPYARSTLPELANLADTKDFIYLDVNKKTVLARKTLYFDKAGKLIAGGE